MTRRGHVYRRRTKTGGWTRWYAVVDVGRGEHGKRQQVTRAFDTRRQAYAWLADQASDEVSGPTVSEFLPVWLSRSGHLRPSTVATYLGHVDNYLVPLLGDVPVGRLGAADVEVLHHGLAAAGVSTALARRVHATLSSALTAAVHDGLLDVNPARRMRLPQADRYQPVVWSASQAGLFLARTNSDELAALWRLALVCGLRRGELLGLRWADVELDTATVRVTTTRVAVGAAVVEGPPKTPRARRLVALDQATVEALRRHRWHCRRVHGSRIGVQQPVFLDPDGQPLSPAWVSRRFTILATELGLPVIRFHDLRHTSATLGLAAGESLKEVSARLGHSSIVVTADTYLSPPTSQAQASVTRLAHVLHAAPRPRSAA